MNNKKKNASRRYRPWVTRVSLLFVVLTAAGCASNTLETWHTTRLTEDFSSRDDAETFQDYLAIESRAFEELDEKIVADIGTGPEYTLNRFSRGSASNPESFPQNYNRSYELIPENVRGGALLLHGMSDSPYSLRAIADSLHDAGFHVVNLRLPGHGTAPSALTRTRWKDFAAAVELAMAYLHQTVGERPVHIVGFSNGAPLAVNYALDAINDAGLPQAESLILIAPAIGVTRAAGAAGFFATMGQLPGMSGLQFTQTLPPFDPFRYNSFPTNGATQTHKLTRRIARGVATLERKGQGERMPPILMFKSSVDSTVSNDAVIDRLLGRLPDNGNELILFDINRLAANATLLVDNPGPFAERLVYDNDLPFAVTLITNESLDSRRVVSRRKPAGGGAFTDPVPLEREWPEGTVSLSHISITFPPDDPLYGSVPPEDDEQLFLGGRTLRGERGLLRVPDNWFTRQRYNPFFDYLEQRLLDWLAPEP